MYGLDVELVHVPFCFISSTTETPCAACEIRTSSRFSGKLLPSTCVLNPNSWLMHYTPRSFEPLSAKNHIPS